MLIHFSFRKSILVCLMFFCINYLSGLNCCAKERILFLSSQLKSTEYYAIHQNARVLVGLKNHLELKGKLSFIDDSTLQVKGVKFKANEINFICVKEYDKSFKIISGVCYLISGLGVITEIWLGTLEDATTDATKIDTYQKIGGCVSFPLCGCGLLGVASASGNKMLNNSKNFDLRTSYKAVIIPLREKSKYVNELYKPSLKTGIDD